MLEIVKITDAALNLVNEGRYDEADAEMKLADDAIAKAHDGQTYFLQKEAGGEKMEFSVYLYIHRII